MMRSKINFTLLLLLLCSSDFLFAQQKDVGDKLKECYLKDKTKLSNCLIQFWNEVFVLMRTGIPRLNIPNAEPMLIDQVRWDQKGTAVDLNGLLSNLTLAGLSNSVCTLVKVDKKLRKINFNMTTPFINITSDYNLDGTIMLLPIKGNGKLAVNASDIHTTGQYNIQQYDTGVKIVNMTVDLRINHLSFKFFQTDTDPVWDAINKLISENVDALFDDIKPTISKILTDRMTAYTSDAYKKMPAEAFIA